MRSWGDSSFVIRSLGSSDQLLHLLLTSLSQTDKLSFRPRPPTSALLGCRAAAPCRLRLQVQRSQNKGPQGRAAGCLQLVGRRKASALAVGGAELSPGATAGALDGSPRGRRSKSFGRMGYPPTSFTPMVCTRGRCPSFPGAHPQPQTGESSTLSDPPESTSTGLGRPETDAPLPAPFPRGRGSRKIYSPASFCSSLSAHVGLPCSGLGGHHRHLPHTCTPLRKGPPLPACLSQGQACV